MIIVNPGTLHWVKSIGNEHSVHLSWNLAYLNIIDVFIIIIIYIRLIISF